MTIFLKFAQFTTKLSMNQPLVILGSSRSEGNTRLLVETIFKDTAFDIIDLNEYNIHYYTYDNRHTDDDFLQLAERMIRYDTIIFATPVYWYAMSAILKTFFDRITDLLTIRKDLGRALKGKMMYLISCGSDDDLPEGFTVPFEASATYLNMQYGGSIHAWVEHGEIPVEVEDRINVFKKSVIINDK